jgi:hypothetical protein
MLSEEGQPILYLFTDGRTKVALIKPLRRFEPSPRYIVSTRLLIRCRPLPSCQIDCLTAAGPRAAMASTAPSYRPEGGLVAPKGDGNGDDSRACVTVDNSPEVQLETKRGRIHLTRQQAWIVGSIQLCNFAQHLCGSGSNVESVRSRS